MYRDIDGTATVVLYLNHLLVATTLRHPDQSAKTPYAVVDMDHVVANLKLLYLLQRQRHLAAARLVGAKVVFMETVEYLMVRKDTYASVVVGKTGMEGLFDGIKKHGAFLGKDVAQAVELLATVGQDAQPVALCKIVFQGLLQQFEILMKLRLWTDVKR